MRLDVIIPISAMVKQSVPDRLQNINFAIETFYGKQSGVDVRMIVVEQSLDGKFYFHGKITDAAPKLEIPLHYPLFNKNWCLNVGVKHAETDPFIIADSDMWCPDSYFALLVDRFTKKQRRWGFGWNSLCYTGEAEKALLLRGQQLTGCRRWTPPKHGYSEGGVTIWTKSLWDQIGGADEFFECIGGLDNELAWRAWKAAGTYWAFPQSIYHLHHKNKKKSSWPQRTRNINLLRASRKRPGKINAFLKSCEQGNMENPAVARCDWNP